MGRARRQGEHGEALPSPSWNGAVILLVIILAIVAIHWLGIMSVIKSVTHVRNRRLSREMVFFLRGQHAVLSTVVGPWGVGGGAGDDAAT